MQDRNQQQKENCRSAEAALKTREEQLRTTEKLHTAELEKQKQLIGAEEERTFKAYEQCAQEKQKQQKEKQELVRTLREKDQEIRDLKQQLNQWKAL